MSTAKPNLADQIGQANSKRSAARLAAVQALYQMDVAGTDLNDVLIEFQTNYFSGAEIGGDKDAAPEPVSNVADSDDEDAKSNSLQLDHGYFEDILKGILKSQTALDPLIDEHLRSGWRLNRIDSTLRAILRAGAYELQSRHELSVGLIIDEYLNIAHAFFEGDEPKVVNAVLDKLAKSIRTDGTGEDKPA